MADSVTLSITPGITITSSTAETTGATSKITVRLPDGYTAVEYSFGTGAAQVNAMYVNQISLVTSTPQTLDLTALTGGQGDTSFSKLKCIAIYNNETAGTNKPVILGNGTNPFVGPFGAGSHTLAIPAGCGFIIYTKETAGWAVANGSTDGFKLDPGANNVSVTIALVGNS